MSDVRLFGGVRGLVAGLSLASGLGFAPRSLAQGSSFSEAQPEEPAPTAPSPATEVTRQAEPAAAAPLGSSSSVPDSPPSTDHLPRVPAGRAARVAAASWRPHRLPYEPGDPIPAGYHVEEHGSPAMLWTGGAIWAVAYGASVLANASSSERGAGWALVPIVGPFAAVTQQRVVCEQSQDLAQSSLDCSEKVIGAARRATWLLVDGLAQFTGAVLFSVGLANTNSQLVLDSPVALTPELEQGRWTLRVRGVF